METELLKVGIAWLGGWAGKKIGKRVGAREYQKILAPVVTVGVAMGVNAIFGTDLSMVELLAGGTQTAGVATLLHTGPKNAMQFFKPKAR